MSMPLQLVHHAWKLPISKANRVAISVPRLTLMKRRWQIEAPDGARFGFDLETPLHDGAVIFESDSTQYVLAQEPEPVLEISWASPAEAARLGWSLGNLHFPVEIGAGCFRVSDDSAVRQLFEREAIPYRPAHEVFQPRTAHSYHAHGHAH